MFYMTGFVEAGILTSATSLLPPSTKEANRLLFLPPSIWKELYWGIYYYFHRSVISLSNSSANFAYSSANSTAILPIFGKRTAAMKFAAVLLHKL